MVLPPAESPPTPEPVLRDQALQQVVELGPVHGGRVIDEPTRPSAQGAAFEDHGILAQRGQCRRRVGHSRRGLIMAELPRNRSWRCSPPRTMNGGAPRPVSSPRPLPPAGGGEAERLRRIFTVTPISYAIIAALVGKTLVLTLFQARSIVVP